MEYQRQSVRMSEVAAGRAELLLAKPGSEPCPLFGADWPGSRNEPWAFHFRIGTTQFKNLEEIHTYTKYASGRNGTRRRPRWKRDSIVVWPPGRSELRYLEFDLKVPADGERVGQAYSISSTRYQLKFQSGRLAAKSLVFIAGCGRSGTTLLQRLMRSFDDTHVARGERPFTAFIDLAERPEKNFVVKRDANTWQVLPWLPPGVKVLYCVRHPFDVLTSIHPGSKRKGFYISLGRWRSEYMALKQLMEDHSKQLLVIRYEDLVMAADEMQGRIEAFAGLDSYRRFSDAREALSVRSVRKWTGNAAFGEYLEDIRRKERGLIDEFLDAFGYDS